jgi:Co/Zn/Cd efflux system component
MSAGCCNHTPEPDTSRLILWIALAINAAMFAVEIVAGVVAGSVSLHADALDFLADSFNYAISLSVIGLALTWRARAAMFKGLTMGALGLWVIGEVVWQIVSGRVPEPFVMGAVGTAALLANAGVAVLLYRFRSAESNLRSAWICSRNDVLGNLAVLLAAAGVLGTGTLWPDVIVASIMASLAIQGSWVVVRQSLGELNGAAPAARRT